MPFLRCRFPSSHRAFGRVEVDTRTDAGFSAVIQPWNASDTVGFANAQGSTTEADYMAYVQAALGQIRQGAVKKVVMSRVLNVPVAGGPEDPQRIYAALSARFPEAFVFWLSHPVYGTWLGASPEVLLHRRGHQFSTVALAGTRPASARGPWSKKLCDEQQVVTEYIAELLHRCGASAIVVSAPQAWRAGNIEHLRSAICFEWSGSAGELLAHLHPTPAVCGAPAIEAAALIGRLEQHRRKLYTGYCGLVSPEGNEEIYFVNLRCMQWLGNMAELFAGGGINAGSSAEEEWMETENKLHLLRQIIAQH